MTESHTTEHPANMLDDRDQLIAFLEVEGRLLAWAGAAGEDDEVATIELRDLDSFAVVQLFLAVEDKLGTRFLEEIDDFVGTTFEHLADFLVARARPSH